MHVLFTIVHERRFALDCAEIIEVLPVVSHRPAGTGPAWLLGLINVRGELLPLVDLSVIVDGKPTQPKLASRIVVLRLETELFSSQATKVGLLVPEIAGPVMRDFDAAGVHTGFAFTGGSHLGPTIADEDGMVQLLRCRRILEGDAALRQLPATAWDQP
jgi:chemotaxis-related protein WspB